MVVKTDHPITKVLRKPDLEGLPRVIVIDNGRQFVDRKLTNFIQNLGIKHVTSSVEHP